MRMLEEGGRYGGLETVLVVRTGDGELAGAAKIYRLEGHVAGVAMPMMGLAAVAVDERFRRRGYGAWLCARAIEAAADRGDVLSALYPFRPDYYRRIGWGLVGELHEYRVRADALPRDAAARHVRRAEGEGDREAIAACYARVARRSNGPITRDARVWGYRLSGLELGVQPVEGNAADPKLRVVVYDEQEVTGYALLRPQRNSHSGETRLDVRELVAESERAYRGLLGFLARHAKDWSLVRHFARPEERFGDRVIDPRPPGAGSARNLYFPTARIVRGPMLRIVDVPGALRLRRWFDAAAGAAAGELELPSPPAIRIRVNDPERPENKGPWLVRLDGGASVATAVEPGGTTAGNVAAELETSADVFARIFVGEIAPTDAARLDGATVVGNGGVLDRAFATRETFWLPDRF